MKVDNEHDRQDTPGECDRCGSDVAKLKRYYSYGPGHQVDWLCPYCRVSYPGNIERSLPNMLNLLEYRVTKKGGV